MNQDVSGSIGQKKSVDGTSYVGIIEIADYEGLAAYAGAAGTIHALQLLKHYGYLTKDYSHLLGVVHSSFLNFPDVSFQHNCKLAKSIF